ncbi:MAG: hypothetical protein HUJ83_10655 [Veillonella sp.]|nr:hypothetical protein [Veillonella sp.]
MANYKCNDCGTVFDESKGSCPNCGCPLSSCSPITSNGANQSSTQQPIDDVLTNGRRTDAEAVVTEIAENVLRWGELASKWLPFFYCIYSVIMGIVAIVNNQAAVGLLSIVLGLIVSVILYYLILILAKIIWGVIMLFVNISTTLKRIEILLENKK